MSDSDGKKTLGLRGGSRPGSVKQSFSHGRTKNVVVETKRKRVVVPKAGVSGKPAGSSAAAPAGDPSRRPAGISDVEMERRLKALQAAKAREFEESAQREADEQARAEERERRRAEAEAKEREEKEREERARAKADEEERERLEAEAAEKVAAAGPAPVSEPRSGGAPSPSSAPRKAEREREARPTRSKGRDDGRRSGKLTLNQALAGGEGGRQRSMAAMKRKQERARQKAMGGSVEREKVVRDVQLPEAIVVSELANRMAERVGDVVKSLMQMGMMVTQNQTIDADTAELIIEEFGHKVVRVSASDVEDVIQQVEDDEEEPATPAASHYRHGSRGPRQDLASRCDPQCQGCVRRSRRHYATYWSLSGDDRARSNADFPRHSGSRGLHVHAVAWRTGDRHRGAGRCGG